MLTLKAKLDYGNTWCIAWADKEIGEYYYNLIPKYYYAQRPMNQAHITVVSKYDATSRKMEFWGKYQDKVVEIEYEPFIERQGQYFGITCYSKELEDIREEMGLTRLMGDTINFHMTVGNTK